MRSVFCCVTLLLAATASAEGSRIGVVAVESAKLSTSEADALADALIEAAREELPGQVLGPPEVAAILEKTGTRVPKRCKAKRCWLKVGTAAELTAVVTVRAVAKKRGINLSIKWFAVDKKRVVARLKQPMRKDLLTFADDARVVMQQLRAKVAPGPTPAAAAVAPKASVPGGDAPVSEAAVDSAEPEATPSAASEHPRSGPPPGAGRRVWLGLALGRGSNGGAVQRVTPGGPAAAADLQPGDLILAWDGWLITTAKDVLGFAMRTGPGGTARIKVSRGGTERTVSITLEEPSDAAEADAYEMD